MTKEKPLSEKRKESGLKLGASGLVHPALITFLREIEEQDKEAIKRLKEYVNECYDCPDKCEGCLEDISNVIDKIFGEELSK